MSVPVIYCDTLKDSVPKCANSFVIQTSEPLENVKIRIQKFNGQVRYYDLPSDAFGLVNIPVDGWFIHFDAEFIITATLNNVPIYFVSNYGYHQNMRLKIENTDYVDSVYFVNQDIYYICCEEFINCLCTPSP